MMNDMSYDSSDDDGADGLFTPGRGRRQSLVHDFTPTPSRSDNSGTPGPKGMSDFQNSNMQGSFFVNRDANSQNALPKLQDTSWIGARMSPIPSTADNDDDDDSSGRNENDAIVAPYRLGLSESASTSGFSESMFLAAQDDTDDVEEAAQSNNTDSKMPGASPKIIGRGTSTSASRGYIRPRPPILLHPHTSATNARTNMFGSSRDKTRNKTTSRRRNRRRLLTPFERKFWNFWSALRFHSPDDFVDDADSSYVMVDGPARRSRRLKSNRLILWTTGLVLFSVGVHDGFLSYLAMRRGVATSYPLTWDLPWIGPAGRSLLRFGAFCPQRLQTSFQYWRSITSLFLPISITEWILLVWVWTMYLPSSIHSNAHGSSWIMWWPTVYGLSAFTGQLWMAAYHHNEYNVADGSQENGNNDLQMNSLPALSGCAGWATAGVLCAVGIQKPNHRFPCFLSAIAFVILHQCQATGSVIGCSVAAFFGWALAGTCSLSYDASTRKRRRAWQQQQDLLNLGYTYHEAPSHVGDKPGWNLLRILAAGVVGILWVLPLIVFFYW